MKVYNESKAKIYLIRNASRNTTVPSTPWSRNREVLSPILESDALYQQAGWISPQQIAGNNPAGVTMSESEDDEAARPLLDTNSANQGFVSSIYSSHSLEMSPPLLEVDVDAMEGDDARERKRLSRGFCTDGLGTARAALCSSKSGNERAESGAEEEIKVAQRSANLIQNEMMASLTESGKLGKYGNGFRLIDFIRPMVPSEDFGFEDSNHDISDKCQNDTNVENDDRSEAPEDEMTLPKSMREVYNLSNANRRRTDKEKATPKFVQFDEGDANIQPMKEDNIAGAESVIASHGGPGGYFGSSKRQRTGAVPPGKEGDIELLTRMGWVKDKTDAESLAVISNVISEQGGAEKEKNMSIPKKSEGKVGSFDYYSSVGAIGAFDPNTLPSNNPFFAGAATSAASMLTEPKASKSGQKRNKKR